MGIVVLDVEFQVGSQSWSVVGCQRRHHAQANDFLFVVECRHERGPARLRVDGVESRLGVVVGAAVAGPPQRARLLVEGHALGILGRDARGANPCGRAVGLVHFVQVARLVDAPQLSIGVAGQTVVAVAVAHRHDLLILIVNLAQLPGAVNRILSVDGAIGGVVGLVAYACHVAGDSAVVDERAGLDVIGVKLRDIHSARCVGLSPYPPVGVAGQYGTSVAQTVHLSDAGKLLRLRAG